MVHDGWIRAMGRRARQEADWIVDGKKKFIVTTIIPKDIYARWKKKRQFLYNQMFYLILVLL